MSDDKQFDKDYLSLVETLRDPVSVGRCTPLDMAANAIEELLRKLAMMTEAHETCKRCFAEAERNLSARGDSWNWRLVTQGGYESYRTYLVTDGTSTVTGFHTPKGWVRHDSIDAEWTPTHWQPIPHAPK